MSFLNELNKQKNKLKETGTVVTNVDGRKYLERGNTRQRMEERCYGFVVDTKPDNIPVMIVDHLYIGSQDCAEESVVKMYDIIYILSLGVAVNVRNVQSKFIECLDLPETDVRPVLLQALPYIYTAVNKQHNILVHCNAGVSRTALISIAYLMQYQKMTYDSAYSLVKDKRPAIQPNTGFVKQLQCMKPGQIV